MNTKNMYCCPNCGREYSSYRSLHRHKTLKHPENISSKSSRIRLYDQQPQTCQQCLKALPYNKRHYKFCNRSCSATYNNMNRSDQQSEQRIQGWRNKYTTLRRDVPNKFPRDQLCLTCDALFTATTYNQKYCSPQCNVGKHSKAQYRLACRFKVSPKSHPSLYNDRLIARYGWYAPTNKSSIPNLTGVCWDHLYRVSDGYANNVDPKILSHPANAELVPWTENKLRTKSMITIETLKRRIQQWDSGDRNLPKFLVEIPEIESGPTECKSIGVTHEPSPNIL